MARLASLQQLVEDLRWQADIERQTRRHTDKKLVRALNQSIQAFRLRITDAGHDYYLRVDTGTFTAGDNSISFGSDTSADDVVSVYAMDVQVNGEWRDMFPFQRSERNSYESGSTSNRGIPTLWRLQDTGELVVLPFPDQAYPFRLWVLPTGDDLTASFDSDDMISSSSDSFDGIAGWEDWVIHDAALRVIVRDASVNDNFELLSNRFTTIDQRVVAASRRHSRGGPLRRRDTRGQREYAQTRNAHGWETT